MLTHVKMTQTLGLRPVSVNRKKYMQYTVLTEQLKRDVTFKKTKFMTIDTRVEMRAIW